MSRTFITAIIFFILFILSVIVYKKSNPDEDRSVIKFVSFVTLGLSTLFLVLSSFYIVPVQNQGIISSFGKPTGDVTGAGLHLVFPWQEIKDSDASVQTTKHLGDWDHGCTTVRIGSLSKACVENVVRWKVTESGGPALNTSFKYDFDSIRKNYVDVEIQNALNLVFSTYNPLTYLNLTSGQLEFDGLKLQSDVLDVLKSRFGYYIDVASVSIPFVHHDAQTESNIKQIQDVIAQARILDQKKSNAEKERLISDLQRKYLTPDYLKNKCIEESVKMGIAPGLCLMQGGLVNVQTSK